MKGQRLSQGLGTDGVPELQLMRNAEFCDNEVKLLEKIDDIAEGSINSCSFNCQGILATGSG